MMDEKVELELLNDTKFHEYVQKSRNLLCVAKVVEERKK